MTKLTIVVPTYLKLQLKQASELPETEKFYFTEGQFCDVDYISTEGGHYKFKMLSNGKTYYAYGKHVALAVPEGPVVVAPKGPLTLEQKCLKLLKTHGWNLTAHPSKIRDDDYLVMFGIRDALATGEPHPANFWQDEYDDRFICASYSPKQDVLRIISNDGCTTRCGKHYTLNPMNPDGGATLKSGVQFFAWKYGMHGTRRPHSALVQSGGEVTVTRDKNKDGSTSGDNEYSGWFGINIHSNTDGGTSIGRWSAGCQVFRYMNDLQAMLQLTYNYESKSGAWGYGVLNGYSL